MLWLCLHFPQFPLELRQPSDQGCAAVCDHHGSRRLLLACNEAGRAAGLHRDMDVTTALGQLPSLKVIERSKPAERAALQALCAWAEQFSSVVCFDAERWLLWCEIGASLGYFGGVTTLTQQARAGIEALGYTARIGVAPTLEAAALFAQHAYAAPISEQKNCAAVLSGMPLHLLAIPAATIAALHGVGWNNIGDVLALPQDQLARRFGPEITRYLRRLMGREADPRKTYRAPAVYRRCCPLSDGVTSSVALLFPLRRLLGELQGYLRGRDTALQALQISLAHERRPATLIELRTTAPQRDAGKLLALLREKLDRASLSAPVVALTLAVDQFVAPGDTQLDLFDEKPKRDTAWSDLIDKLRARLGDHAVHRLGLNDDHRPEQAWCFVHDETPMPLPEHYPERPLWLLTPKHLERLPRLLGKPERIEAGWWDGEDASRDYYVAQTQEGSRWWLYRDINTAQWFLHGLWA